MRVKSLFFFFARWKKMETSQFTEKFEEKIAKEKTNKEPLSKTKNPDQEKQYWIVRRKGATSFFMHVCSDSLFIEVPNETLPTGVTTGAARFSHDKGLSHVQRLGQQYVLEEATQQ